MSLRGQMVHTIVWRNRNDLDIISLDDLYNHLKVYESEVQKKGGSSSQNMAFISSSNTNSGKSEVLTTQSFSTASGQVSTATFAMILSNMALLSMRADRFWKKTECRAPMSQDRSRRESYKKESKVEESSHKEMMAIDDIG
ncbi:hypothetical protein Tco_0062706 [Tanacetum coccineum]